MSELSPNERTEIYTAIYRASTNALKNVPDPSEMTPAVVDEHRMRLAALYALLSEEIGRIEILRAPIWVQLKLKDELGKKRDKPLSDNLTDKLFDMTPDGIRRIEARACDKGLEKVLNALSAHMRRINEESRNSY